MERKIDINQTLSWYIDAGIDATVGEVCGLKIAKPEHVKETAIRPAVTTLSQADTEACKNARDLCLKATNLQDLKTMLENFDGCALKLTAKSTVFGYGSENASIMIIGEAPGADEDRRCIHYKYFALATSRKQNANRCRNSSMFAFFKKTN